jgi:glutamate racemase
MWVPLIESGEHNKPGADYFVEEYVRAILNKDPQIDTLVLGCTHYPLLQEKIAKAAKDVNIIAQGDLVAHSLKDYLSRHPEYRDQLSLNGTCTYLTTENADRFSQSASNFLAEKITATTIQLVS